MNGAIGDVNVRLVGLGHAEPGDIEMLLAPPAQAAGDVENAPSP